MVSDILKYTTSTQKSRNVYPSLPPFPTPLSKGKKRKEKERKENGTTSTEMKLSRSPSRNGCGNGGSGGGVGMGMGLHVVAAVYECYYGGGNLDSGEWDDDHSFSIIIIILLVVVVVIIAINVPVNQPQFRTASENLVTELHTCERMISTS